MGLQFGNLVKLRGITFFRLSPYEQNPFAGMWKEGPGNFGRTLQTFLIRAGPMFLGTYALMQWAHEENRRMHRKPQ